MKLLILGGTIFLGKHLVHEAIKLGHEITLFNRGNSNPELFPQVEQITGDRDGSLTSLMSRRWDAVIDTCGYVPRIVRDSVEILADNVENYTFISTISVYQDFMKIGIDESYPVAQLEDESIEKVDGETYGPLKALCENKVLSRLLNKALIIRPGLIVGPDDPTDRFTYWPIRIAKGDQVLAPGNPEAPIQVIDVRDLSKWILHLIHAKKLGIYNVTGPNYKLTMRSFLNQCKEVLNTDTDLIWMSEQFLKDNNVTPWTELPLWLPEAQDYIGLDRMSIQKSLANKLNFRPLSQTILDTYNWHLTRSADYQFKTGLSSVKESELLLKWAQSQGSQI